MMIKEEGDKANMEEEEEGMQPGTSANDVGPRIIAMK